MRAVSWFVLFVLFAGGVSAASPGASQEFVLSRLFAATEEGAFVSYSWGEHWSRIRGDMRGFTGRLEAFLCLGPVVYAGGSDGLFISDDFGESYRRERFPGTDVRGFLSARLFALEPTLFVWTRDALYRTTDAGRSWESIGSGLAGGAVRQMAWPGPELIVLTEGGLHLTRDAGRRWEVLGDGLPSTGLTTLAVARYFALEPTIFVGSDGAGLFKSIDGGKNFEVLDAKEVNNATVRVVFWWGSLLLVGTNEGLLLSNDAGESFTVARELEALDIRVLSIPGADADIPSDVLVGTTRGVYKSSDGAMSFRLVDEGMGTPAILDLETFPILPQEKERQNR